MSIHNKKNSIKMTTTEQRAVVSLSSIMGLRMIGLFMVLPVFSLYARQLEGATPLLIGWAMGIYGLSQALCQIPLGMLSDRFGRKPIILIGLLIFAIGSLIAAKASSIHFLILGRILQGAGAIGSTILALMADLTREEQRTKAMAIAGITIGFSFSLAMLVGPVLTQWLTVSNLFLLASLFSGIAILTLYSFVPTPRTIRWQKEAKPELASFLTLLLTPTLAQLNTGIFILHAIFTASFIVIPMSLNHAVGLSTHQQWFLYLPTLLIALIISLFCVGIAERKKQLKPYFLAGILSLTIAEILFCLGTPVFIAVGLCCFFSGFTLLEAFLPSLISRTAPTNRKGSALGIYSCSQFLGIFTGGVSGGWLYGQFNFSGVYLFCVILSLFWLALAFLMQPPRYLITHLLRLLPEQQAHWESIVTKLEIIPGIVEITFIAEEGIAYLKMEQDTATHPDFIRLQEQLQSE